MTTISAVDSRKMTSSSTVDVPKLVQQPREGGFPLFTQLLPELRLMIWEYCLPGPRVQELEIANGAFVFDTHNQEYPQRNPCGLGLTSRINANAPLLSRICHESRSLCSKERLPSELIKGDKSAPERAIWYRREVSRYPWMARGDMPHLNWAGVYNEDWGTDGESPLHVLAWRAKQMSSPAASFTIDFLDSQEPLHKAIKDRGSFDDTYHYFGSQLENSLDLDALPQIPRWLAVMRIIVVHAKLEETRGLFGMLCDARIQILEIVQDANKIEELFRLARECESRGGVRVPQDLRQDSHADLQQRLLAILELKYRTRKLGTSIQPAIMFRLCTNSCNRPSTPPWLKT